jgi:protein-S-isoprenylcysteine O-methyltransferase Ste14
MPDEQRDNNDRQQPIAKLPRRRMTLWVVGLVCFLAVSLFWPAGRLGWVQGWLFLLTYVAVGTAASVYLWRTNPEVIIARSTIHRGKGWDGAMLFLLIFLFMAMYPVAGLDAGRFHWSSVPLWLSAVGYVLLLIGMTGNTWVLSVNKFAEPAVRIQTERQHRVVDTGPYAIVRHPLYATSFFLCGGIPLALGSYWAFAPAGLGVVVLVVRTVLEDRMLQNELEGYRDYAARVRYRLVPGVW